MQTKGYKNHPQLLRFSAQPDPLSAINQYLLIIYDEALGRGFAFDNSKINPAAFKNIKIPVTSGQMIFEINHLKKKLWQRDRRKYFALKKIDIPLPNPLFNVIKGGIEQWEKKY